MKRLLPSFAILCLLALPGCDDKAKDEGKPAAGGNAKPADGKADAAEGADKKDETAKKADSAPAEEAAAEGEAKEEADPKGATFAKLGVAACDQYFTEFSACVEEHGPPSNKAQVMEALHKTHEQWTDMLAGPGKDKLEESCKASVEAAKASTRDWGCTWSEG